MERPWLVLLVVGCVLLAGCSLPGEAPTNGGSGDGTPGGGASYPQGWSADGLSNATLAVRAADSAVAGDDFVERRVSVQPAPVKGGQPYLVDVLVVRVDRENGRLLSERRFYRVSNETARRVVDSGTGALGDRRADEVRRTFFNASGGFQYYRLGDRQPRVTSLDSGTFDSATDQPLPAVYASAVPMLASGTFSSAESTDGSVTYEVRNVSEAPFQRGAGTVTVRENGLVPAFNVTQSGSVRPASFTYELDRGDLTVERPGWLESNPSGGNGSGTPTADATPTSTPGTTSTTSQGTTTSTPTTTNG